MAAATYASFVFLLPLLSAATAEKGHHHTLLRHGEGSRGTQLINQKRDPGYVERTEFAYQLRVCNAFPYAAAMDVYNGVSEKLTDAPMPYKACEDFSTPLKAGDKLRFKVGDANAGTFSISDLPNNDAILLLVIHRHDTLTNAVSFESHVFASLVNAQVVIIDTYKGSARSTPRIQDEEGSSTSRSETLRYNSVVAVNPGKYEIAMAGTNGTAKMTNELVAVNRESYVVLRTGVEAQQGESYPEEVVIFPKTDEALLYSGAMPTHPTPLAAAVALICALTVSLSGGAW